MQKGGKPRFSRQGKTGFGVSGVCSLRPVQSGKALAASNQRMVGHGSKGGTPRQRHLSFPASDNYNSPRCLTPDVTKV